MSHEPDRGPLALEARVLEGLPGVVSGRLRGGPWIPGTRRIGDDTRPALVEDSRRVLPGDLFVAVRGGSFDGHDAIPDLQARGVCTVGETGHADLRVEDSRGFLALASEALEDHASGRIAVIGITGTNGKTTTAWLLHRVLSDRDAHCGHSGTLGSWIGPEPRLDPGLTTPPAPVLSALAADIARAGGRHLVMEVSSHSVHQRRVEGLQFRVAVFLNLSPEHLDYHRDLEDYYRCKADFMTRPGITHRVVITDDAWGLRLAGELGDSCVTAGARPGAAWHLAERHVDGSAQVLVVRNPRGGNETYRVPLPGAHNAQNALAALVTLRLLGLDHAELAGLCGRMCSAPGRLELLEHAGRPRVVIDYAHTPDGYAKCYRALEELKPRRILTVFGCGGDRDRQKRPVMAGLAEHYSDTVIVTTDNPRTEDPARIREDIEAGLEQPELAHWITDRAEAIRRALELAGPEDLVLLLGKGHERYQILGREKHPFDERTVVREAWHE